jgi:hypothetical protein|tara:strand:- start:1982 stop:2782 length:801 start_codon:yes stop_codon:yes gene_type:complete
MIRDVVKEILSENMEVRGYVKPLSSFFTLEEWESFVFRMLRLQESGFDTRGGGENLNDEVERLMRAFFSYQLDVEVSRYDLLTTKNVYDLVEDFVNHRFWSFERTFGGYFSDISKLKFAYFYSRGDLEPYVLLDDEFTSQLYGSINNPRELFHFTTLRGVERIKRSMESGNTFDISCFTTAKRPFFRKESNVILRLVGNVRAGFRSDIKSLAVDNGRRCCNLFRLEYPGRDKNNICYDLDSCNGEVRTSLWNEYIATPVKILEMEI